MNESVKYALEFVEIWYRCGEKCRDIWAKNNPGRGGREFLRCKTTGIVNHDRTLNMQTERLNFP